MALIPRNPKINQGMGSEAAEAVFDFPSRRARIPSMNAAGTSERDPGQFDDHRHLDGAFPPAPLAAAACATS